MLPNPGVSCPVAPEDEMVRMTRRALLALGLLLLLVFAAGSASATSGLNGKLRYGDTVDVPASETVNSDLYVFAGRITINGIVHGDVVAFGGTVTVTGNVDGDVIAAGGTVAVSGTVGRAIRVAAGDVVLSGHVTNDVLSAGGRLTSSGPIGGDLVFWAGQASVSGPVTGSIEGRATSYTRSGTVGGTESVTIQEVQAPSASTSFASNPIADALREFVAVVLFGALLLWILPGLLRGSEEVVRRRPVAAFVGGLAVIVGYLVAILALLVVMIVLAIAFGVISLGNLVAVDIALWLLGTIALTVGLILAGSYVVDGVVGLAIARRLAPRMATTSRWQELGLLAAGAVIVVIATSLPVVGPLVTLIVVLVGLGAIGSFLWAGWNQRRAGPAAGGTVPPA
jgi:hypothetical protein